MGRQFSPLAHSLAADFFAGFAPPRDLRPSEWAERSVYIPVGNAVPGLIRFDNAPYQREPLDMTVSPDVERITLKWGGQVGKTLLGLCAQGFRIAERPENQLMMQPSQGDLATWLETKFNPMVEANPELASRVAQPRAREGVNNSRMKSYPGGIMMFAWAGSPKTMRGRSAPFIVCDETDAYDRTAEGHPVSLLWQRAATYGDRRLLLEISTPTIKGVSHIDASYEAGDQRTFHVRCPHCEHLQPLVWGQVRWDKDGEGEHLPETAHYLCSSGRGCWWDDADRVMAIRQAEAEGGGWIAAKPTRRHLSYHLSELYSCFRSLSDVVQSFLEKKATDDVQSFVNLSLAEVWEEEGEASDAGRLMDRAEEFPAPVPAGVGVLTAGADIQPDRIEVEVVGWGLGEESWSVDYQVFWGDVLKPEVWLQLFEYLGQDWEHESGARIRVAAAAVDTGGEGGMTQAAYEMLRGKQTRKIFAIKGAGGWNRPVVAAPRKSRSGQRARPVTLFMVGVDEAKLVVMRRLNLDGGPGSCHFPVDRDPEFFLGLTSEHLRTRMQRGFPVRSWHKVRERNEPFDCRVYAYAALKIENPNIKIRLARLAPEDETLEEGEPPEDQAARKRKTRRRKPRRSRGRSTMGF